MHEKSLYSYRKHDLCSSQHPFVIIIIAGNSWFQFLLFFNCIFFIYIKIPIMCMKTNIFLTGPFEPHAPPVWRLEIPSKDFKIKTVLLLEFSKGGIVIYKIWLGWRTIEKQKNFKKLNADCGRWKLILQKSFKTKPLIKILRSFLIYYLFLTLIFYSLFLKKKRKKACVLSPLFPV